MIRINLVPPSARRPFWARWRWSAVPLRRLAILGVSAMAFLAAGLWLLRSGEERTLGRLRQEWRTWEGPQAELDAYQNQMAVLKRQADHLARVRSDGLTWAPRLNLLSDTVSSGVWFTRLSVEAVEAKTPLAKAKPLLKADKGKPKRARGEDAGPSVRMTVEGTALVPQKEEGSPLMSTLQSLKRHPEFSRSFSRVEVKSAERRMFGSVAVTDFVLVFEVKDPLA